MIITNDITNDIYYRYTKAHKRLPRIIICQQMAHQEEKNAFLEIYNLLRLNYEYKIKTDQ